MSAELARRATTYTSGPHDVPDEELAEVFAPDVEMDFTVRVFNPKVYVGYDGLREFRAEAAEVWEELVITTEELIEHGDRVLVLSHVHARGRGSGIEIDTHGAGIWTVKDGRLWRYRLLRSEASRDDAIAALSAQSGM
jgi:ketosteroid isomerase-like protein